MRMRVYPAINNRGGLYIAIAPHLNWVSELRPVPGEMGKEQQLLEAAAAGNLSKVEVRSLSHRFH